MRFSSSEGNARVVWRDAWGERDGSQVRDLMLILPVVVHLPNLFGAAARADKENYGFGDAVDAAAEAQDDLVGKSVRYRPGHILAGLFAVLLAEDLRVGGVAGVVEPAVDDQPAIGNRERAKGHHGRVGGRGRPLLQIDLLRRAGGNLRRQALGDEIEDARVGQIGLQRGVEGCLQLRGLGIGADRLEIRRGQPDALVAEARSGMNPVLSRCGDGCQSCQKNE
jgi:hypothetical protein